MNVRKVEVVPYRTEWMELFQQESQRIKSIFVSHDVAIHHIGSTSVPGLSAKPIIDLLAEASDIDIFDEAIPIFEAEGYIAKGENGIAGRRFFIKNNASGERLYHLHAFQTGSPDIHRHLLFRDYLRQHPEEAARYAEIKITAAKQYPNDIASYISYKDSIVKEIETKAIEWGQTR
ncbi:GrpB family protein [Neobacillus muris]|uniref:GrpB family protein n=1 Tax=Neobacillus muris TaxID=2941334 RepID=UPI00203D29B7|nr:GrpB family protein [Neobacillus muris]